MCHKFFHLARRILLLITKHMSSTLTSSGNQPSASVFWPCQDADGSLRLSWPKRHVNMFAIEEVTERLSRLALYDSLPHTVPYTSIDASPLRVVLRASSFGERHQTIQDFAPLPRARSESEAKPILRTILQTLYSLHKRKLCCGALSPSSFLWNPKSQSSLLLLHVLPPTMFVRGTPAAAAFLRCCAPEVEKGQPYGAPSDVWAFGVVAVHLLTKGADEFETDDLVDTNVVSPVINHLSPSAVSLMCQCLKSDATARPTIMDLVMHPFFADAFDPATLAEMASLIASSSGSAKSTDDGSSSDSTSSEDEESDEEEEEEECTDSEESDT